MTDGGFFSVTWYFLLSWSSETPVCTNTKPRHCSGLWYSLRLQVTYVQRAPASEVFKPPPFPFLQELWILSHPTLCHLELDFFPAALVMAGMELGIMDTLRGLGELQKSGGPYKTAQQLPLSITCPRTEGDIWVQGSAHPLTSFFLLKLQGVWLKLTNDRIVDNVAIKSFFIKIKISNLKVTFAPQKVSKLLPEPLGLSLETQWLCFPWLVQNLLDWGWEGRYFLWVAVVEKLCLPLFQEGWSFASWILLGPGWEGSWGCCALGLEMALAPRCSMVAILQYY